MLKFGLGCSSPLNNYYARCEQWGLLIYGKEEACTVLANIKVHIQAPTLTIKHDTKWKTSWKGKIYLRLKMDCTQDDSFISTTQVTVAGIWHTQCIGL